MRTAVMLFTCDLRVIDHPALAELCATAEAVVALCVLDPTLLGRSLNRDRFLHQSLVDLRSAVIDRGGDLVIRRGNPVAETIRLAREVAAETIGVSADVSHYARWREQRLRNECDHLRAVSAAVVLARLLPRRDPSCPKEMRVSTSLHV
jgi:deoxyribodipyrimidine photo-lyase